MARINPTKPLSSQPLHVLTETYDADGDLLRTTYRWFINDKPVSGATGERLTPGPYRKGDIVTVEVTVTDGPNDTVFLASGVEIANSPPVMKMPPSNQVNLDGLKIVVTDPDDDPITFSLQEAPPGLDIDPKGVLHYQASDELKETKTFKTRIVAEDTSGEQAIWELTMTLHPAVAPTRRYTQQVTDEPEPTDED